MKHRCIMVQGTASSVGKSLLVTALCRIFSNSGFRVAPFKAQNMSLNSFVTKDGLEMGRAQVVQAEAARVLPSADMNPILLKPSTDRKSQIIVNGKVYGNMDAKEYYTFRHNLKPFVYDAFTRLSSQNDIIVIEGAGSPAEINLQEDDLVNMGMAQMVDAPVILVGDIDKGGVFAQLYGTIKLLPKEDQKRVIGFIINKFRGDVSILNPGIVDLEKMLHIPCYGVLPYRKFDIDEEDSMYFSSVHKPESSDKKAIDIAVIKLPRISNFTDFRYLEGHESVNLRYVENVTQLKSPHLIIIPGSKSTISDLLFLRESGLEAAIKRANRLHIPILGICGGYQMLGMKISDPNGVEGSLAEISGIGLLEMETVFYNEKITRQSRAVVTGLSGIFSDVTSGPLQGYEIHMGSSTIYGSTKPFMRSLLDNSELEQEVIGSCSPDGFVLGTYLHGVFDNKEFTKGFLESLVSHFELKNMGVSQSDGSVLDKKDNEYNLLADFVESAVDFERIKRLIGL